MRTPSVGSFAEMRCTRCRAITNHTIVAMVGEQIARVECNTCHGVHNYRPIKPQKAPAPAGSPEKKKGAPRTTKMDPAAAASAEWEALQSTMNPGEALPYDMGGRYRANTLLTHPRFGLGIVQLVLPGKMEVLFQEGKKRLLCG